MVDGGREMRESVRGEKQGGRLPPPFILLLFELNHDHDTCDRLLLLVLLLATQFATPS